MHQILFVIHLALLQKLLIGLSILVPVAFIATTLYGWAKYKQADLLSPIIGIAIGVGIFVGRSYIQHDLSVYAFGVMMVLGFFAAIQLAKFLARHSRIDPEVFVNAGLIALITGVAGARLSHVLENIGDYTDPHLSWTQNLWNAVNISSGGLTYYGGIILAVPCTIAYGLYKNVPIRVGMDIVAPCVMLGLGFGRIGCFLNGCCYGAECQNVPWAVEYPYYSNPYLSEVKDNEITPPPELRVAEPVQTVVQGKQVVVTRIQPMPPAEVEKAQDPQLKAVELATHSKALHPAQLYSTLTAWLIAALLVAYYTLPHAPGRGFALMLIVEPIARYLLELLRAEPPFIGHGSDPARLTFLPPQSFSMTMSFFLIIVGVVLWFAFRGPRHIADRRGAMKSATGNVAISAV